MTLATTADVAKALGRSLTAAETDRATQLLEVASSEAVQAAGGYAFAPGSYTRTLLARDCKTSVRAKVATVGTVRAVDSVTGAETVLTGWTSRGSRLYQLGCDGEVEVDFTVTDAIPVEVVAVVAGIVAATIGSPPVGAESESAGPFSISYVDSSGRVWLSASDRRTLGKYRRGPRAIRLA